MIYKKKLHKIKNFIFDVDGVFTDGSIIVDSEGNEMRVFNTKDGIAVKFATDIGYNFCVISGGNNEGVRKRLSKLGVKNIFLGVDDKKKVFDNFYHIQIYFQYKIGANISVTFRVDRKQEMGIMTCFRF